MNFLIGWAVARQRGNLSSSLPWDMKEVLPAESVSPTPQLRSARWSQRWQQALADRPDKGGLQVCVWDGVCVCVCVCVCVWPGLQKETTYTLKQRKEEAVAHHAGCGGFCLQSSFVSWILRESRDVCVFGWGGHVWHICH